MFKFFLINILLLPVIIGFTVYEWNSSVNKNGYHNSPSPVKYLTAVIVVDVLLGLVFTWKEFKTIPNGKLEIIEGECCIIDPAMYCNGDTHQVFTLFLEDQDMIVTSTDTCSLCGKWYINHYSKKSLETIQDTEHILSGWIP